MSDTGNKHLETKNIPEKPEDFMVGKNLEQEKDWEKKADLPNNEPENNIKEYPSTSKQRKMMKGSQIPNIARDPIALQVEKIMEENLADAYEQLSPIAKQEFKIKGEKTALAIRDLMKSAHIKVKRIFQLIFEWLKILPGANRFFLEQEAKVKTDKIILLHKNNNL